jgi:phage tail-like protein
VRTSGLNATVGGGISAAGLRTDPYGAFNFWVEIEGLVVGGFSEISGLQIETETLTYREGGLNEYVHQLPGPARYPQNLSLKRGLTIIDTLWPWYQDVLRGTIKRRNGTIYLLNQSGVPLMAWNFLEAYPVRWNGPDFRAGSSDVAFESLELAHRGIAKVSPGGLINRRV